MRILILAGYDYSLTNFRGPLIREMLGDGHEVIACAPREHEDAVLAVNQLGARFQSVYLKRVGTNPAADLITLANLVVLFRAVTPDLVFAYTVKPVIYGSLAAHLTGVSNINALITGQGYTFRPGGLAKRCLNKLVRRFYRSALKHCRRVFFQNPDDRAVFIGGGLVLEEQAVLIDGSGVDLNHFQPSEPPAGPPVFLLIGRMLEDKGIREYVEAARTLKSKHPETRFRLLGPVDPNQASLTLEEIESRQAEGVIEYEPYTSDVRPALSASTVFVLPSYGEGTPRTVLEAMASGRAVITTDVPGCRETVVPENNGLLVRVRDAMALARAMERFVEDPGLAGRMGRAGRKMAEQKYDVVKINARLLKEMGLRP